MKLTFKEIALVSNIVMVCLISAVLLLIILHIAFYDKLIYNKSYKRNLGITIIIISIMAVVCLFGWNISESWDDYVKINEIYVSAEDDDTNYIEIVNTSKADIEDVVLKISDDENIPEKVIFQLNGIKAGELLCIPLDSERITVDNSGGQVIRLYNSNNEIIDSVTIDKFPKGKAYAKNVASSEWEIMVPTPGMINKELNMPVFSVESGFYDDSFELALSTEDDADIYYTLDGSTPDVSSSLYTEPILIYNKSSDPNFFRAIPNVTYDWYYVPIEQEPVDKITTVRAVCVSKEGIVSDINSATYIIELGGV